MGYIKSERDIQYKKFEEQMSQKDLFSTLMLIDFNLTELCNRTCEFCPRVDPKVYPNRNLHMDPELYTKIIEELAKLKYNNRILLCGFGEPLLYKYLNYIINITKTNLPWNHNLQMVTNGDKLSEKVIEKLFFNGLDKIYISLYEGPEQQETFTSMFRSVGISPDKYFFHHYYKEKKDNYGFIHLSNRAGKLFKDTHGGGCNTPFYEINIDYNGNTLLCAHDWNKSVITGNLQEQSLKDIWLKSPVLKQYREMLQKGRDKSPCKDCNIIGTLYGKKSKQLLCSATR